MTAKGTGTKVTGFDITREKRAVASKAVEVPEGATKATVLAVCHVTGYNGEKGGAGFIYVDVFAGNDFGTEETADYDTGKWNNVSASNQTEFDVTDENVVRVEAHVRCDEALKFESKFSAATLNAIIVFE